MAKRLLILFVAIAGGAIVFSYIAKIDNGTDRSSITSVSASAAISCAANPSSDCVVRLAVSRLPNHIRFGQFDDLLNHLRLLGHSEVANSRLKSGEPDSLNSADVYRLYDVLSQSVDRFKELPLYEDPFVYSSMYFLVSLEYPGFGGRPELGIAEEAALTRRGGLSVSDEIETLMSQWKAALEQYGESSFDWLLYATRARELGDVQEAKAALARATNHEITESSKWTVIYETWQLHGLDDAMNVALKIEDGNRRDFVLLNIANRLLRKNQRTDAHRFYNIFAGNFESTARRNTVLFRQNRRSAALAAHTLGKFADAEKWAGLYAKGLSTASPAESLQDAAILYAEIGAEDLAVISAFKAIELAPAPGLKVRSLWIGTWSTTDRYNGYLGTAMSVLCKFGRYEEAFSLGTGDPDIGDNALSGCLSALDRDDAALSIDELATALHLHSPKKIERHKAISQVQIGDYIAAASTIRESLDTPPSLPRISIAWSNFTYLRLAVAMRNEPLTQEVLSSIVRDSVKLGGEDAARLLARAATIVRKWPEDSDID